MRERGPRDEAFERHALGRLVPAEFLTKMAFGQIPKIPEIPEIPEIPKIPVIPKSQVRQAVGFRVSGSEFRTDHTRLACSGTYSRDGRGPISPET
ncbi:MAG: hypothetical protein Kow00109_18560 [Acidobacteriota bacterium]